MDLTGKVVKHAAYGYGTIIDIEEDHIKVKFISLNQIKTFVSPDCFQSHLKLLDQSADLELQSFLYKREKVQRIQAETEERNKEERLSEQISTPGAGSLFPRVLPSTESPKQHARNTILRPFPTMDEFCDAYEKCLTAEIAFLRENGGKRQRIFDGKLIYRTDGKYIYSFEAESELNYPDGIQITLWQNEEKVAASIIGCEDYVIVIASSIMIGEEIPVIEFSAEPWHLINSLIERLSTFKDTAVSPIVRDLVCNGFKYIQYGKEIIVGQDNALISAENNPITFVWGPPGTGKTETLANIAWAHMKRGSRVLMLSYSNVSVDGAILRVYKLKENTSPGKLLRYGYPKDKALLKHEYLTSYNLAIHKHPDLFNERTQLIERRKHISRNHAEYVEIGNRLSQIRAALTDEERASVQAASFVATTVSKAIVDKTIYDSRFDVVIFDEASMAFIPQIVFAASLAKKHFICMGDFNQLPPIVQSSSSSILNADIFRYCGITDAVESGNGHQWLRMLDKQYRMHPVIADFASFQMYQTLLQSAEGMGKKRDGIVSSEPLCGVALGLADLSGMMSVCTQTADSSRINPLSAFVSLGLALTAARVYDVGIISPYNAQARLLHAMSRDVAESISGLHSISCATVHQFQGSEKDVIIYDAVDCYRQPYPGTLLTSSSNNYANRLFNVALTRAKGKFIAVTNADYMSNKLLSANLMFAKLLRRFRHKPESVDGRYLSSIMPDSNNCCYTWYNQQNGDEQYLLDISKAKKEIHIDIPGEISCDSAYCSKLQRALEQIEGSGVKIVLRTVSRTVLSKKLQKYAIENKYIYNPVTLIDKRIVWFGEPASSVNFITSDRIIIPTKYRPVIRFTGKNTANALYGFLEMNRTIDQTVSSDEDKSNLSYNTFAMYISGHLTCKKCGRPMKLLRGKGKFFLGCSGYPNCKSTELATVDMVEKYFSSCGPGGKHCPQDHTSLVAKLGPYGIYIQCCALNRHIFRLDEI